MNVESLNRACTAPRASSQLTIAGGDIQPSLSRRPVSITLFAGLLMFSIVLGGRTTVAAPFTIMTQNMYEGTNFAAVFAAQTPAEFITAIGQTFTETAATQPVARAGAIAQQIAATQPALVGLQEVSTIRTGPFFDPAPATNVVSDQLASLLSSLSALGKNYTPVVIGTGLDAEAPSSLGFDVRLTRHNVILARTDLLGSTLTLANTQVQPFSTILALPTPVGPIVDPRGWVSVDATLDGQSFRFVVTHLEPGFITPVFQFAQAQELLAGAGNTTLPIIYAGDFNAAANNALDPTFSTYQTLLNGGLTDAWALRNPNDPGLTCCQQQDLLNVVSQFTDRFDLMLFSGPFSVVGAELLGLQPGNIAGVLWPSDHAGLLVTFDVPEPESIGMLAIAALVLGFARRHRLLAEKRGNVPGFRFPSGMA